jgi:hypothetical protein
MLLSSGSLFATEFGIISHAGDTFFRYSGVGGYGMIDALISETLAKYDGSWLSVTEKDMLDSLSGSTDEQFSYKLSQALSRLSLDDIENYLIEYPIWKETRALGSTDGLMGFEVELAKDHLITWLVHFIEQSTGTPPTKDQKEALLSLIEKITLVGTISYDPTDARHAKFDLTMQNSDGETTFFTITQSEKLWQVSTTSSGNTLLATLENTSPGYVLTATAGTAGTEVARLDAKITIEGTRFAWLDATMNSQAQWVTLSLQHIQDADGAFSGKLDAGIGQLNWGGTIDDDRSLSKLKISGAMIGSNLLLDLTPSTGGLLTGPLMMKSGEETITEGTVRLRVDPEHLDFILDIKDLSWWELDPHIELSIHGKKEKTTEKVTPPKDSKPFTELSDALSKVMPTEDIWTAEPESLTWSTPGTVSPTR